MLPGWRTIDRWRLIVDYTDIHLRKLLIRKLVDSCKHEFTNYADDKPAQNLIDYIYPKCGLAGLVC